MLLFHSLSWYKKIMAEYRKAGYHVEIFFVFADLPIMEKRAKEREKSTGRQTDLEHVRLLSQLHVPKCLNPPLCCADPPHSRVGSKERRAACT